MSLDEEKQPVGPDFEIEKFALQYEAMSKIRNVTMPFWMWVEIQTPRDSNAWAYEGNRRGGTLISF